MQLYVMHQIQEINISQLIQIHFRLLLKTKKSDAQNPIIGKLLAQIESSKLSNKEARLSNHRRNNNYNNNHNDNYGNNLGGRSTGGLPRPLPPPPSTFAGATAPLLQPPRGESSVLPYPVEISPLPDYNTLFTERLFTGTSTCQPVIGVIPCISEVEPSAPEPSPEDQIKLSPTLRITK